MCVAVLYKYASCVFVVGVINCVMKTGTHSVTRYYNIGEGAPPRGEKAGVPVRPCVCTPCALS